MSLDEKIEQARRHIESGRAVVDRQRRPINAGSSPPGAAELLKRFLQSQAIFEGDLERFLKERDGFSPQVWGCKANAWSAASPSTL